MSCASCSHAPCSGATCLVNYGSLPLHCATLHMHHASMHHALCNMPHAPCPMHHAPLPLQHAALHVHHATTAFQQSNCDITLLRGEWGHSAQSMVQGHKVHCTWAWGMDYRIIVHRSHPSCNTRFGCPSAPESAEYMLGLTAQTCHLCLTKRQEKV